MSSFSSLSDSLVGADDELHRLAAHYGSLKKRIRACQEQLKKTDIEFLAQKNSLLEEISRAGRAKYDPKEHIREIDRLKQQFFDECGRIRKEYTEHFRRRLGTKEYEKMLEEREEKIERALHEIDTKKFFYKEQIEKLRALIDERKAEMPQGELDVYVEEITWDEQKMRMDLESEYVAKAATMRAKYRAAEAEIRKEIEEEKIRAMEAEKRLRLVSDDIDAKEESNELERLAQELEELNESIEEIDEISQGEIEEGEREKLRLIKHLNRTKRAMRTVLIENQSLKGEVKRLDYMIYGKSGRFQEAEE